MRLYEVIQLLEYNKGATLNKWGERIAQAAKFNRRHLGDSWFTSNADMRNYDPDGPEADEFIAEMVLEELEKMDPTNNRQYVMTLVRWYIGNIKKDKQLQAQYDDWRRDFTAQADPGDSGYPEDYHELEDIADEIAPLFADDFGNYVMNAENLNTFMLEDADQIRTALANFERMKPQLQPNERDIGRYKSFYRFEDFVDSKMDPEAKAEIENELLNRSDVKVLYNGPMGTVAIPHSHEASCKLGSGTKWCTTDQSPSLYNHYSQQGDLMIYNEKPGNEKYQIHVTLSGIEIRDSRDRTLPRAKYNEFTQTHPVISKLIQKKGDEIFAIAAQQPWTTDAITSDGGDPVRLVRDFIKFNNKHQGGVMRYVDEYYTKFALPSILDSRVTIPNREMVDLMLTYAKQRGKPWPEMMDLMIQILRKAADSADLSSNIELKSINRLVAQLDTVGSNPKLEQFKSLLLAKIQKPVQEAPNLGYGMEGKPEWYDRAVQMKLDNPGITAKEIARQVGANSMTVTYWLTGNATDQNSRNYIKRPHTKDWPLFEPNDFPRGYAGRKPEWVDQALKMAKAGETFTVIGKKLGVSDRTISNWLVKGRKDKFGNIINPDAELEPRRIVGQKLDVNLINSFIQDWNLTDKEIIELVADEKGPKIAGQVRDMLPVLRKKLNPGTQVIDKTRSMRDPDITGLVQ